MGESLTQPRRVSEEGLRVVSSVIREKRLSGESSGSVMVPKEEAPANSVPAAAVIQRVQALFGFTGRKACVGCIESRG